MTRRGLRLGAPIGALVALLSSAGAFAGSSAPPGSVHQAKGKAGCYTEDGVHGKCHDVRGGAGATSLAISPDGRFAYLVGYGTGGGLSEVPALAVLARNAKNGTLTQLPGKSGCFSRNGSSEDGMGTCTKARDLGSGDATSLVISNDGRFLYVASQLDTSSKEIGGIAIFQRNLKSGKLTQLKGRAGCMVATAYQGCAVAREVDEVANLHFTPDHKFLYASDYNNSTESGIATFTVDPKNGTLHQLNGQNGCITIKGTTEESGSKKVCRAFPNIDEPWDVATPDNRFVYIPASYNIPLVQVFKRNAQGGLVPLKGTGSCISDSGTSPAGACVTGHGLENPERAVFSKNGRFVYIASYSSPSSIAVLNRNPKTGTLSERSGTAACIAEDSTSCRDDGAVGGNYAGALSPDGKTLYFSEYDANGFVVLRVSPKTGAFSPLSGKLGCVTVDGSSEDGPGMCATGRAVAGAYQIALASNGRDVYVASNKDNGDALFYAAP